jgi:HSP20 family molecular chaperone IbpA
MHASPAIHPILCCLPELQHIPLPLIKTTMTTLCTISIPTPLESLFLDSVKSKRCSHQRAKMAEQRAAVVTPTYSTSTGKDVDIIEVELPGVAKDSLKLEFKTNLLVVTASRGRHDLKPSLSTSQESAEPNARVNNISPQIVYEVKFKLPERSDSDSIEASYRNGLLTIHVSRRKEPESRRIAIGSSTSEK